MSIAGSARPRRTYARVVIPRRRLLDVLLRHRGERAAITADSLAVVVGVRERDNRSLRQAITELITEDGLPVGSTSVGNHSGYYVIETEAELQKVLSSLRSRVRELERRMECLRTAFKNGPAQPALFTIPADPGPVQQGGDL